MPDRAPISPSGWKMSLFYYKTQELKPFMLSGAYALSFCQRIKAIWHDKKHDGKTELIIAPVDGWDSIKADFAGAIAWAIAQNLVSIEHGASLIRAIAEERADSLPAEALMGLAVFYARAALTDMGGDDEIEQVVDKLVENQRRLVVGIDEPAIPF